MKRRWKPKEWPAPKRGRGTRVDPDEVRALYRSLSTWLPRDVVEAARGAWLGIDRTEDPYRSSGLRIVAPEIER